MDDFKITFSSLSPCHQIGMENKWSQPNDNCARLLLNARNLARHSFELKLLRRTTLCIHSQAYPNVHALLLICVFDNFTFISILTFTAHSCLLSLLYFMRSAFQAFADASKVPKSHCASRWKALVWQATESCS